MISVGRYRVDLFDNHHRIQGFTCGVEALDRYFYQQANQDRRRKLAVAYVLVDTITGAVLGYYSLSTSSVVATNLHAGVTKGLPRYRAFPSVLIGRLAVDRNLQGQGLGAFLLMDALRRCYELHTQIGVMAVVVDAKNDMARGFYQAFGFVKFVDEPYRLYMPVRQIAHLFE